MTHSCYRRFEAEERQWQLASQQLIHIDTTIDEWSSPSLAAADVFGSNAMALTELCESAITMNLGVDTVNTMIRECRFPINNIAAVYFVPSC